MRINKRLPTAFVLLGLVFVSIQFFPRFGYFCAVQVVILASLVEFYNLCRRRRLFPRRILGILLALIICFSFYLDNFPLELALFLALLVSGVYFVLAITTVEKMAHFPASIALTLFGALYLSLPLSYLLNLREEYGPFYIYFLFAVIFTGDTGAYAFGKLWGRRKLAPIASPNKTWEGSLGGILVASLGGIAAWFVLLQDILLWKAVVFAILVHAVAQVSDPLESLFKRAVGVKDSSNVLPGHGGFLDRVDSLILATPFFYYLLKFIGMN